MCTVDITCLFGQVNPGLLGLVRDPIEGVTFDFPRQKGVLVMFMYLNSCTWPLTANLKSKTKKLKNIQHEYWICNLVDT